jgi:hypothetical protein
MAVWVEYQSQFDMVQQAHTVTRTKVPAALLHRYKSEMIAVSRAKLAWRQDELSAAKTEEAELQRLRMDSNLTGIHSTCHHPTHRPSCALIAALVIALVTALLTALVTALITTLITALVTALVTVLITASLTKYTTVEHYRHWYYLIIVAQSP